MDKQEALDFMFKHCLSLVTETQANEIREVWGMEPMRGVRVADFVVRVIAPKEVVVAIDTLALSIARELNCPDFPNPMKGDYSSAEWTVEGCCVQIALKECLVLPDKVFPKLAKTLKSVGTVVPKEWVA